MSTEKNIAVLNEITKTLIDSCKGYEMCQEVAHDSQYLKKQFQQRQDERQNLVNEFQAKILSYGGEVETKGSFPGAIHRGYTKFVSLFKDDQKAAIDALDTGEEFLAEHIESKFDEEGLTADSLNLLKKAHAAAISGEKFADRLDD